MGLQMMEKKQEKMPTMEKEADGQETNSGLDHNVDNYSQAIQDDEADMEIYNERQLNNGQLYDPSGNHQWSAFVLSDETNNNAPQTNRGIKRQCSSFSTMDHFQPRKILCLLVEVDDDQDLEALEDPKDPEEPKEKGNKLPWDLDLLGHDF